jgi:hypothetical protein
LQQGFEEQFQNQAVSVSKLLPQTEKIPLRVINALMEYINKCGDMGHIKQNNYANYIALKYIFLNLHKKKSCPPLSADSFLL